jgi:hypothetical protein
MDNKNKEGNKWFEAVFIGIAVIIIEIVLHKTSEHFGLAEAIIGAFVTLIFLSVFMGLFIWGIRCKHDNRINELITAFRGQTNHSWLLSSAEINEMERMHKSNNIWIISPDLSLDTGSTDFLYTVVKNIKRGVRYTYFVSDTNLIKARLKEVNAVYESSINAPRIITLKEAEFFAITRTHIAMYNPEAKKGIPPRVFVELPLQNRGWWVEMSSNDGADYIGRISKFVQ